MMKKTEGDDRLVRLLHFSRAHQPPECIHNANDEPVIVNYNPPINFHVILLATLRHVV